MEKKESKDHRELRCLVCKLVRDDQNRLYICEFHVSFYKDSKEIGFGPGVAPGIPQRGAKIPDKGAKLQYLF